MPVLEHLQPANVLHFFEALCAIPHGSGNTKAISDYCVAFARDRGLQVWQDESNNVVIAKEASPGYEDAPGMILQGHLDMVCEKAPDCDLDMTRDGLRLQTDGQWVWAEGTTLGGDDGIAVAMALAILDDDSLPHPRLETLFTVDEETGMEGAVALDPSMLRGRLLLNVDSEQEGVLTVSCAGGVRASCHIPVERETAEGVLCTVTLGGLAGGHSGVEIDKGRANSNVLMGRLLYALYQALPLRLVALRGGQADNAIPRETTASFLVPAEEASRAGLLTASHEAMFRHEYEAAEPKLFIQFESKPVDCGQAMTLAATARVISALMLLPAGIQSMSMEIPGLVQTSLNMGILRLEAEEAVATFSIRSSLASEKAMLCSRMECLAAVLGGRVTYSGDYPAWEYKRDSKLRELVAGVYEQQTGQKPVIEAIHAGLECGVLIGKLPDLDCISLGPNLREIHTARERMDVASVARTYALLCEVLRRAKEL